MIHHDFTLNDLKIQGHIWAQEKNLVSLYCFRTDHRKQTKTIQFHGGMARNFCRLETSFFFSRETLRETWELGDAFPAAVIKGPSVGWVI